MGRIVVALATLLLVSVVPATASATEESAAASPPGMSSRHDPNPQLAQTLATSSAPSPATASVISAVVAPAEGAVDVAGLDVSLYLEPARHITSPAPQGAGFALVKLATGTVQRNGDLDLRVPFITDFTGYQDQVDQSLSVLLMGGNETATVYRRFQVRPPTEPGLPWALATPDEIVTTAPFETDRLEDCAARFVENEQQDCVHRTSRASLNVSTLQLPAYPATTAGANGADHCSGNNYSWVRSDAHDRSSTIDLQRVRTGPYTRVAYNWQNSRRTETDSAANLGRNGALVAAGYTKVQSNSAGATFHSPRHAGAVALRAPYRFKPYYLYCQYRYAPERTYYSGVYEWRAFDYRGGATNAGTEHWTCQKQFVVPLSRGNSTWVARTTTSQVFGGVSLFGVGLRRSQTNSQDHKLTYYADHGNAQLCGKDADPPNAKQVREIG